MHDLDDLPKKNFEKYKKRDKKYAASKVNPRDLFSGNHIKNVDLKDVELEHLQVQRKEFHHVTLTDCNLHHSTFQHSKFVGCKFIRCNLSITDFSDCNISDVTFENCNLPHSTFHRSEIWETTFTNANLSKIKMHRAVIRKCRFEGANFSQASLYQSEFTDCSLDFARFIETNFHETHIMDCSVFGTAVWKCNTTKSKQLNLTITPASESQLSVDNIKVAQFIYLILGNEEIRDVIDTVASKAVLILGRFNIPKRKAILDALKGKLREYDLLPIVFDFDKPIDKDLTETVKILAGLSLFVIADVTNPKSTPLELQAAVPDTQTPFIPIIQDDERPFAMMADLQSKYDWMLNTVSYDSEETLMKALKPLIIDPAIKKHQELRIIKAQRPEVISAKDFLTKGEE